MYMYIYMYIYAQKQSEDSWLVLPAPCRNQGISHECLQSCHCTFCLFVDRPRPLSFRTIWIWISAFSPILQAAFALHSWLFVLLSSCMSSHMCSLPHPFAIQLVAFHVTSSMDVCWSLYSVSYISWSRSSWYIFPLWADCLLWPTLPFLVALFACILGPRVFPQNHMYKFRPMREK